jgi:hypothetical protein
MRAAVHASENSTVGVRLRNRNGAQLGAEQVEDGTRIRAGCGQKGSGPFSTRPPGVRCYRFGEVPMAWGFSVSSLL